MDRSLIPAAYKVGTVHIITSQKIFRYADGAALACMASRSVPRSTTGACEAKFAGTWGLIDLAEADGVAARALKRCSSCHGPVVNNGSRPSAIEPCQNSTE